LINGVKKEQGTPVKKSNPLNFAWRRNVSAVITEIYPNSSTIALVTELLIIVI